MKVSKEQAEQNRDALLDAASRPIYREHGLEGVGVAQIAREAGLTHGSLYGHFESKDHFAAEACEHAFVNGINKLKATLKQPVVFIDSGANSGRFIVSEALRLDFRSTRVLRLGLRPAFPHYGRTCAINRLRER